MYARFVYSYVAYVHLDSGRILHVVQYVIPYGPM